MEVTLQAELFLFCRKTFNCQRLEKESLFLSFLNPTRVNLNTHCSYFIAVVRSSVIVLIIEI